MRNGFEQGAGVQGDAAAMPDATSQTTVTSEPWRGALVIGRFWASWRGRAGDAALHKHFAAQAIMAPESARLRLADGQMLTGRWLLVDPLVVHRLDPVQEVVLHFLEPAALGDAELAAALAPFRTEESLQIADSDTHALWRPWLAADALVPARAASSLEPALRQIDDSLQMGVIRLSDVARRSGVSASRFRHRFAAEVGLPFRRYVLWRRVRQAVVEIEDGADATTAAHAAGFADLAHFSRALKAMFGVSARQALNIPGPRRLRDVR